jgi:long-chain acyl-CoA synthetase
VATGNSFESFLVAVVFPKKDALLDWAKHHNVPSDFVALCQDPSAIAHVLAGLKAQAKESKLKGFEFIKAVHLHPEEFSIEKELVTPTFKFKRPQLQAYFQKEIDEMYKQAKSA